MPEVGDGLVPITLNDLPKYSHWPKLLLSQEPVVPRHKTEQEVVREFQDEKWGGLLKQALALGAPSLLDIEQAYSNLKATAPFYDGENFYLASQQHMLNRHLDLYAETLGPHIKNASCLVELGAGFGSKILSLSQREGFSTLPLIACEYTRSGRDLIHLLAKTSKKSIAIGNCDFWKLKFEDIAIPEDAVIFTSYAVHYIPELSVDFVQFLARCRPRAVVHFEPCYEHYAMDTLHGMMCRRYVEVNDYTRNLVTVVAEGCRRGGIPVRTRKNVLGSNPFLPISVIEWTPGQGSNTRT